MNLVTNMRIEAIINLVILVVGVVVAIAPWTFAPVCASQMRCWNTRDVETVLGASIALLALVSTYRLLAHG